MSSWCHFEAFECIFHLSVKKIRSLHQRTRNQQNRAFPNLFSYSAWSAKGMIQQRLAIVLHRCTCAWTHNSFDCIIKKRRSKLKHKNSTVRFWFSLLCPRQLTWSLGLRKVLQSACISSARTGCICSYRKSGCKLSTHSSRVRKPWLTRVWLPFRAETRGSMSMGR